jgi:acetyl esterase
MTRTPPTDPRLTDPDAAAHVARWLGERRDWVPAPAAGVSEVRRRTRKQRLPDDADVSTADVAVPAPGRSVPARWYEPADPTDVVVVFFHGGGWVIGDLEMNDAMARSLARLSRARVLSVDYRLAPEHPYPAALEDGSATLDWVAGEHPAARLVLAGHSAGGNLAAVLTQRAAVSTAGGAGPVVHAQVLLCPVLDCDLDRGSYADNGEGLLLTTREMRWYWDLYQPDPDRRPDPSCSPLRAPDLHRLPPTLVVVAGADPLRDEALAYADAVRAAGGTATVHLQPGVPHLYLTFPAMPCVAESLEVAATAVRAVGTPEGQRSRRSSHNP